MKYWLLLIPCLIAICPWAYNLREPMLFGFPFFYWFQLLLIPAAALFTLLAYLREKR